MEIILIILAVLIILCVAVYWLLASMYRKSFGKHSEPNARSFTYGYDFYAQRYPRREVVFPGKRLNCMHLFMESVTIRRWSFLHMALAASMKIICLP